MRGVHSTAAHGSATLRRGMSIAVWGAAAIYPESRAAYLVALAWSDPLSVIQADASINDRVAHLFLSVYGFFQSLPFAIGHGTGAWREFLGDTVPRFPFFFAVIPTDR